MPHPPHSYRCRSTNVVTAQVAIAFCNAPRQFIKVSWYCAVAYSCWRARGQLYTLELARSMSPVWRVSSSRSSVRFLGASSLCQSSFVTFAHALIFLCSVLVRFQGQQRHPSWSTKKPSRPCARSQSCSNKDLANLVRARCRDIPSSHSALPERCACFRLLICTCLISYYALAMIVILRCSC